MHGRPSRRDCQVLAGVTAVVGPAAATLSEAGHLRLFPAEPLYEMWLLAGLASLGAGIGAICVFRGARIAGTACVLSNAAVLILYGFIAVFFSTGGSR
jgi:hypothetical protein